MLLLYGQATYRLISPMVTAVSDQKDIYDILKLEWQQCEAGIGRYDTLIFQARTWSITVCAALIAAAVSTKIASMFLIGAVTPFLFLIIEAQNKLYQTVFIQRSRTVQSAIRDYGEDRQVTTSETRSPGIADAFERLSNEGMTAHLKEIGSFFLYPNIVLFYVSTAVPCLVCYIVASVRGFVP